MQFAPGHLERLFEEQEKRALEQMHREGLEASGVLLMRSLDMRFAGQGFELEILAPPGQLGDEQMMEIEKNYRALYLKTYGYTTDDETEIVSLRVTAIGNLPPVELPAQTKTGTPARDAVKGTRRVFLNGEYRETVIYDENRLESGNSFEGPAIIERRDSTTVVLPQQTAWKDEHGNTVITLRQSWPLA
jgi:N-methylhydantoinase A